jgi:hypothetical protein
MKEFAREYCVLSEPYLHLEFLHLLVMLAKLPKVTISFVGSHWTVFNEF